jgi:MipA family protein
LNLTTTWIGATALLTALHAGAAESVTTTTAPPETAASAAKTTKSATGRPLWELGVGAGGFYLPNYVGSDQSSVYFFPYPAFVYRGTLFKADREGARAVLFDSDVAQVNLSLAGSPPSRSKDNRARQGMPNLPGTFELGPTLNFTLAGSRQDRWRLDVRLPVRGTVSLERSPRFVGTTFSPNLNLDLGGVAGGWNVGLLTGPLFADRSYHGHFYDVSSAYATPERPAYRAAGGYSGWRALAATSRRFDDVWLGAFLRYDNLRGSAFADSPLVRRNSGVTVGFGVSWFFARSSELVPSAD